MQAASRHGVRLRGPARPPAARRVPPPASPTSALPAGHPAPDSAQPQTADGPLDQMKQDGSQYCESSKRAGADVTADSREAVARRSVHPAGRRGCRVGVQSAPGGPGRCHARRPALGAAGAPPTPLTPPQESPPTCVNDHLGAPQPGRSPSNRLRGPTLHKPSRDGAIAGAAGLAPQQRALRSKAAGGTRGSHQRMPAVFFAINARPVHMHGCDVHPVGHIVNNRLDHWSRKMAASVAF
jgi:hypothetical protein